MAYEGFEAWTSPRILLGADQSYDVPGIELKIAPTSITVRAVLPSRDIADQQIKVQEKQRIIGMFPNFYTSYVWDAEPLSVGQKFRLAWKTAVDPTTFFISGVIAGIQQSQNTYAGFGQGTAGYAKRFGASYAEGFTAIMIGNAILPALLRQDPRYFYKGTGSIRSRSLYAISTAVITKGDSGRWQPNYSNVLGNFAAAGISNLYYPASDRDGAQTTVNNALIGIAATAAAGLLQEFLLPRISTGARRTIQMNASPKSGNGNPAP